MNERAAEVGRLTARLAHDVGKYVARTARNVAPGGWTPQLASMLSRDLYDLRGGPASALFEARAKPLEELIGCAAALTEVRSLFAEIDRLQIAVRAGDSSALEHAATLALEIEAALRNLARTTSAGRPEGRP
jgi:hypothetical protein